jgi:hypothetical protein
MWPVKRPALGVLLLFTLTAPVSCDRPSPAPSPTAPASPPPTPTNPTTPAPPGTVGPLGDDCYATAGAVACPPDPTDPSGRKLPAHGGACRLPVCRPCGSAKKLAFRDEHGRAMAGFCICVPKSDDSGQGVFTCYTTEAWKKRAH